MVSDGIRPVERADAELLWRWANDLDTRKYSWNTRIISWEEHCFWLERKLSSADCRIWFLVRNGLPVAHVRYDRKGDLWAEVSLTVAPESRGQGFAREILRLTAILARRELGVEKLIGHVMVDNVASVKAFAAAEYENIGSVIEKGHFCCVFENRCSV